jgi:hypothetical protein
MAPGGRGRPGSLVPCRVGAGPSFERGGLSRSSRPDRAAVSSDAAGCLSQVNVEGRLTDRRDRGVWDALPRRRRPWLRAPRAEGGAGARRNSNFGDSACESRRRIPLIRCGRITHSRFQDAIASCARDPLGGSAPSRSSGSRRAGARTPPGCRPGVPARGPPPIGRRRRSRCRAPSSRRRRFLRHSRPPGPRPPSFRCAGPRSRPAARRAGRSTGRG